MTVHFICRGNAHRSLMAEAYLKSLKLKGVAVRSSGSAADMHRAENEPVIPRVTALLRDHGVGEYAKTRADQLTQNRTDGADVTICMNQIVYDESTKLVTLPANTIVWSVTDSGEGNRIIKPGEDKYKYTEEIYQEIVNNINQLIEDSILSAS